MSMQATIEANKSVVLKFIDAFNASSGERAMSLVDETVSDDFVFEDAPLPEPIRGLDGAKRWVAAEREVFEGMKWTVELLIGEGDHVVVQSTNTGVYNGRHFFGLEGGERRPLKAKVLHLYRLSNGKISYLLQLYDSLGLFQQMGVIPPLAANART